MSNIYPSSGAQASKISAGLEATQTSSEAGLTSVEEMLT